MCRRVHIQGNNQSLRLEHVQCGYQCPTRLTVRVSKGQSEQVIAVASVVHSHRVRGRYCMGKGDRQHQTILASHVQHRERIADTRTALAPTRAHQDIATHTYSTVYEEELSSMVEDALLELAEGTRGYLM